MFRVYTLLSILISFSYAFFSFFHYNDDFGWEIFFYKELTTFTLISLVILLVFKIQIRWQKTWITRKTNGFTITNQGWKKILINESMSIFVMVFIALMLFFFYEENLLIPLVLSGFFLESIGSVLYGRLNYKLVITSKLIFLITNKQRMYYWNDIKSFTKRHNGVIVQLKNGIQTHIKEDDFQKKEDWLSNLQSMAIEKDIYWE